MSYQSYLRVSRLIDSESRLFKWLFWKALSIYNKLEPFPIKRRKLVWMIWEAFHEEMALNESNLNQKIKSMITEREQALKAPSLTFVEMLKLEKEIPLLKSILEPRPGS